MEGGWFHTGDGGILQAGYLTIADRKQDIIIAGGENVSSIEVEDALIVRRDGATATKAKLIDDVKGKVARDKAPSSVEFRDEPARTATQGAEVRVACPLRGGPRAPGQLRPVRRPAPLS